MIYKKCNCTTTTLLWPYLSDGTPCSYSIYNACLEYSIVDDMPCIKKCLRPCKHKKYEIGLGNRIALENKNHSTVQIYADFDYPIFTEKLPWTFETFAGAIGGVTRPIGNQVGVRQQRGAQLRDASLGLLHTQLGAFHGRRLSSGETCCLGERQASRHWRLCGGALGEP